MVFWCFWSVDRNNQRGCDVVTQQTATEMTDNKLAEDCAGIGDEVCRSPLDWLDGA